MIYIKEINLINFRCYLNSKFVFNNNINILLGKNAVGKTSLAEAVGLIGTGKSFRTNADKELIQFDKNYYLINYKFTDSNNNKNVLVSIGCDGKQKKVTKDGQTLKKLSEFIGFVKAVVFSPEDLKIIKGEPKNRRKFLDNSISLLNDKYLNSLMIYNKVLKERNELLKNFVDNNVNKVLLKTYTDKLIEQGKIIITYRNQFIKVINPIMKDKVNRISLNKETSCLVYKPNCIAEKLEENFRNNQEIDLILKTTNIGPHRDDFVVLINDEDASSIGSQGQIRTLALSLKLGLVDLLKKAQFDTVVILDDVFSELDNERQSDLMKLLDYDIQVFITTTLIDNIDSNIVSKSNIININKVGE